MTEEDPVDRLIRLRADPKATPFQINDAIMDLGATDPARRTVPEARLRDAIPVLMRCLRDTDLTVVWLACAALGELGAREAIPDLLDLLRPEAAAERNIDCMTDPFGWYEEFPEESAIRGLALMGATEAGPRIMDCLEAEREGTRCSAVRALRSLGASYAAPSVARRLLDTDYFTRAAAIEFLAWAGAEDEIVAALATDRADVRDMVVRDLGRFGSAKAVLPLLQLLESAGADDEGLRERIRNAVAQIQSRLPKAAPGQVSLGEAASGQVSLADPPEAGRVSLDDPKDG